MIFVERIAKINIKKIEIPLCRSINNCDNLLQFLSLPAHVLLLEAFQGTRAVLFSTPPPTSRYARFSWFWSISGHESCSSSFAPFSPTSCQTRFSFSWKVSCWIFGYIGLCGWRAANGKENGSSVDWRSLVQVSMTRKPSAMRQTHNLA